MLVLKTRSNVTSALFLTAISLTAASIVVAGTSSFTSKIAVRFSEPIGRYSRSLSLLWTIFCSPFGCCFDRCRQNIHLCIKTECKILRTNWFLLKIIVFWLHYMFSDCQSCTSITSLALKMWLLDCWEISSDSSLYGCMIISSTSVVGGHGAVFVQYYSLAPMRVRPLSRAPRFYKHVKVAHTRSRFVNVSGERKKVLKVYIFLVSCHPFDAPP